MPTRWPGEVRRPDNGGAGLERQCHRRLDGSAKGAGGGVSSFLLPVSTLVLPGAHPLLCGKFLGWIEAAARQRGKLRLPKQCHLVPGSPSAKTSEAAGGWWNGGVLGQLSGTVVQWSRPTEGHRCGPKRKPSLVVHRTGGGYAFGRRNLIGALSRLPSLFLDEHLWIGDGVILDVVTTVVASFFRISSLWCCCRPSGVRLRLAGVKWDPSRSWGTVGPTKTNKIYIFKGALDTWLPQAQWPRRNKARVSRLSRP
uniref:Uncharacterized protein n=1 Tax=Oryza glumipatula TaxID=40148 RepID=A0A0E0A1M8_9ORYZ